MSISFLHSRGTELPMNIPAIGLDLFLRTPQACPFNLTMRLYAPKSHALTGK